MTDGQVLQARLHPADVVDRGERNSPFAADAEIHVIPVSLHDVDDRDVRRLNRPGFRGGRLALVRP